MLNKQKKDSQPNRYTSDEISKAINQAGNKKGASSDIFILGDAGLVNVKNPKAKQNSSQNKPSKIKIVEKYDKDDVKMKRNELIGIIGLIMISIGSFSISFRFSLSESPYLVIGLVLLGIWSAFFSFIYGIEYLHKKRGGVEKHTSLKSVFGGMQEDDKYMLVIVIVAVSLVGVLFAINIVLYNNSLDRMTITISTIAIAILTIIAMIFYRMNDLKENPDKYVYLTEDEKKELKKLEQTSTFNERRLVLSDKKFGRTYFILQHLIAIGFLIFAIPTFMGVKIIEGTLGGVDAQFVIPMLLIPISAVLGISQARKQARAMDADLDKTNLVVLIIMVIFALMSLAVVPTANIITNGALTDAVLGSGQLAQEQYFEGVYYALVNSKYTLFSLVIIIIGSLVIIIGKAQGNRGSATMVIGALAMAGVPMIITIMAFAGQITPPDVFLNIFGEPSQGGAGFASLVFAISYTSIVALAMSLAGVFYELAPSLSSGSGV